MKVFLFFQLSLLLTTGLSSYANAEKCIREGTTGYDQEVITCDKTEKDGWFTFYSSEETLKGKIKLIPKVYQEQIMSSGARRIEAEVIDGGNGTPEAACKFIVYGSFQSKLSNQELEFENLKIKKEKSAIYYTNYGLTRIGGIASDGTRLLLECRVSVIGKTVFYGATEVLNVLSESLRLHN